MPGAGDTKTDFGEWPSLADASVETGANRAGIPAGEEVLDLGAEFLLTLGEEVRNVLRQVIGHILAEERLLAFQEELLIAQGTERQPGEDQTG